MKLHGAGQLALPATALASFTEAPLKLAAFTPGITEKTAAFKKLSPSGKQPIVVDDDASVVTDDVEVLKKVAAGELYPGGEIRAAINEWFASSSKLAKAVSEWLVASGEQRSSHESVALEVLQSAEAAAGNSSHIAGAQLTAADVTIAAAAAGFYFCGFTPEVQAKLPKLTTLLAGLYSDAKFKPLLIGLKSTAPGATDTAAFCQAVEPEWTTERTRSAFIEFFEVRYGHPFWASSPVVPHNDPTLLFTNAGMNQYKAIFLGTADPGTALGQLTCAANSQKCIRAGGKHNDLDDVGKDVYHHTFFEMLGNWSFGNYFKDEAIRYAWELLTEVYRLDPSRLYATYFEGDPSANLPPDEEARDLWLRFLPAERIIPGNKKDNFWEMGDQGPCGPCTEIHYDRIGGRLVPELVNMDDPNVLEIWNVVFIQFNREASGQLLELPAKHVDTGMGLERIASVLVDKLSNYATDAFSPIFDAIQAATKARPYTDKVGEDDVDGLDMAYRVVADHIRTLSFAIADGAAPGAEGRDYVLRRVLRRAVRYGDKLGGKLGFFSQLVRTLVEQMGYFYPELVAKEEHIRQTIEKEETAFGRTLKTGAQVFAKKTAGLAKGGVLDGAVIFELYDAFGYPVDLTELMAEELGLTCDMEGFEKTMAAAKAKSRARGKSTAVDTLKFQAHATAWLKDHDIPVTDDSPKFNVQQDAEGKVMAIMTSDGFVDSVEGSSDAVGVVLDTTSFYALAGGQTTDTGVLELPSGSELSVAACETAASYVLHKGVLTGKVSVGDAVKCRVDWQRRAQITPNHTMTHVLNHALRGECGEHVDQKGSDVQPEKFTFDFSNNGPVSVEQLRAVQEACQKSVKSGQGVFAKEVAQADAMKIHGLRAVFGEAYPDPVRVVSVGKSVEDLLADPENKENYLYSVEFCGGTHMKNTAEARNFAIVGETAVAQGVRRITAVTADRAEEAFSNADAMSKDVAALQAQSDPDETTVKALMDRIDRDETLPAPSRADIKAQLEEIVRKVLAVKKAKIAEAAKQVKAEAVTAASKAVSAGAKHLVLQLDLPASVSGKAMPEAYSAIKAEHPNLACLLLAPDEAAGKCSVYTEVPKDVSKLLSASEWLKRAVGAMGGKGGGKPEKAAGSGPDVTKVTEAVQAANAFAESCLAAES